ncbi:MAG: hypothetical protein ACRDFQ_06220 [Anaerolineales bacterium]
MKARYKIFLVCATGLLLAACGGQSAESAIQTGIAQTQQISELETAAAGGQATNTPEPAAQDTATQSASATSSTPFVSVSVDTHCRNGPRVDYKLLTTVLVGEQVEVIAVYPQGEYVVVRRVGGSGNCWLWLRYANQTDFSGYNLPIATMPPTSTWTYTPSPTYTPTWTYTPTP